MTSVVQYCTTKGASGSARENFRSDIGLMALIDDSGGFRSPNEKDSGERNREQTIEFRYLSPMLHVFVIR